MSWRIIQTGVWWAAVEGFEMSQTTGLTRVGRRGSWEGMGESSRTDRRLREGGCCPFGMGGNG